MTSLIATLPMYDWPEVRGEVDAQWVRLRDILRRNGIDAPDALTRGVDDLHALWRNPNLIFAQTCWGPMEQGLGDDVVVVGQPDYSAYEGGKGTLYSSAVLMRRGHGAKNVPASPDGAAALPIEMLRGARFAYNSTDSMSGLIALTRDLEAMGESVAMFSRTVETGGHRASVKAVASGEADACTIDCRSWALAKLYEENARELVVVGWTASRPGLPYVMARNLVALAPTVADAVREAGF